MGNCGWKVTVKRVHDGMVVENPMSTENCMICLEELTHSEKMDGLITRTKCCKKYIHKKCFREWDKNNHTCPQCRTSTITPLRQKTLNDINRLLSERLNIDKDRILGVETTIYIDDDRYQFTEDYSERNRRHIINTINRNSITDHNNDGRITDHNNNGMITDRSDEI